MAPVDPVAVGLYGARSALKVTRDWIEKNQPGQAHSHTRIFLTSLRPEEKTRGAEATRGHWGVETRNHLKRDASLWKEDDHRHRRPRAALNLALTRNALLAIIPFEPGEPLDQCLNHYHRHPAQALNLLLRARPVP